MLSRSYSLWAASRFFLTVAVTMCLALETAATGIAGKKSQEALARAEELLDDGDATAAIELLDGVLARDAKNAKALLLRSTARFLDGQREAGEADLRRAVELEPALRQGWLNLGALEMSEGDHQAALDAFERARVLDPEALENDLNTGAVLLLLGRLEEASEHFERYLSRRPDSGAAYYLVATNYALAGYNALALRHLADAIRRDEKTRVRARTDPNFSRLLPTPEFQELATTDLFERDPGSLHATRTFDVAYSAADARVVNAILDALASLSIPYDRRVEVTPAWALVWADVRIKARPAEAPDESLVEITSPPGSFSPQEWRERVEALFLEIEKALATY